MPDAHANEIEDGNGVVREDGAAATFEPLGDLEAELREGGVEAAEAENERERIRSMIDANLERYALADAPEEDWQQAERLIAEGKSTTVAVKSEKSKKRKPGEALAEAYKEAETVREKKKSKKGKR